MSTAIDAKLIESRLIFIRNNADAASSSVKNGNSNGARAALLGIERAVEDIRARLDGRRS